MEINSDMFALPKADETAFRIKKKALPTRGIKQTDLTTSYKSSSIDKSDSDTKLYNRRRTGGESTRESPTARPYFIRDGMLPSRKVGFVNIVTTFPTSCSSLLCAACGGCHVGLSRPTAWANQTHQTLTGPTTEPHADEDDDDDGW